MNPDGTILLTGSEVLSLLTLDRCIEAVEYAFQLHGEGKTEPPGILGVHCTNGGFHIKAGALKLDRPYFAAKINANFPGNPKQFNLPTIQGVVVLADAENGYPLALLDSIELTILRTGAATGVAAKHLARRDSKTVTICGCGNQGRVSLQALKRVLPIQRVWAYDTDPAQADRFAASLATAMDVEIKVATNLQDATKQSDICVTCTTSTQPFLMRDYISPGTFIAAVGADNPRKQELDPKLFAEAKVVADLIDQCESIGDLHHAIDAGEISRDQVYAELGEVVAGQKAGRTSNEEITIFDSTGMALQDVVAAVAVYERALTEGVGRLINFAD
jgi:alanine dehydrogenase